MPCAHPRSNTCRPDYKLSLAEPLSAEFLLDGCRLARAESLPRLNSLPIPFLSLQLYLAPFGCGLSVEAQVGQLSCLPSSHTQGWMQRPKERQVCSAASEARLLMPSAGWLSVNGNLAQGFEARVGGGCGAGAVQDGVSGRDEVGGGYAALDSRSCRLTLAQEASLFPIPERKKN